MLLEHRDLRVGLTLSPKVCACVRIAIRTPHNNDPAGLLIAVASQRIRQRSRFMSGTALNMAMTFATAFIAQRRTRYRCVHRYRATLRIQLKDPR